MGNRIISLIYSILSVMCNWIISSIHNYNKQKEQMIAQRTEQEKQVLIQKDTLRMQENLRVRQIEQEKQMQIQEQLRIQQIEQEKQKLIQEQEEQKKKFSMEIDKYIRTRKQFDSSNPLKYKCKLSNIVEACETYRLSLKIPHTTYTFVLCNTNDFAIDQQCNVNVKQLTPFQGADTHRVYGYYKCICNNKWDSANSWANKWQKCKKCEKRIYPYLQKKLDAHDPNIESDMTKPHDRNRCEKCISLGRLCRNTSR